MNLQQVYRNFFEALDKFDFERVRVTMEALDWTWCSTDGVPSVEEMQALVNNHFTRAIQGVGKGFFQETGYTYCSSGGFRVTIYKNFRVEILFIVEEARQPF